MTTITNEDCIDLMARYSNNHFDLAIVDPPYGIGKTWKKDVKSVFYHHDTDYKNETAPDKNYFDELFRVSKRQIIFGANYYSHFLAERNSYIVWDKIKTKRAIGSDCELAWTSFNKPMKIVHLAWDGFNTCCERYGKHPHEKPVLLYSWILLNYAKPGWKILDTHLGSGSLAIATQNMGFDLTACEINTKYFDDTMERIRKNDEQQFLFKKSELQDCAYSFFDEVV
ncbi:MAG: site-specific DNA-methyltransferase [Tannerella sp.]|jgi:site-specific DNA-methyltransferase (adenine-specific)|nr:site-specific DNA-methyltransferase [Tannerella sp.]